MTRFLLRQDAAEVSEFAHGLGVEHVARDPVQGLQIAQATAAFLHVRFENERAVTVAAVAQSAFRLRSRYVLGGAGLLAGGAEPVMKLAEQYIVAGQEARIEQRGADS